VRAFGRRSACADRKSTLRIGEGRRPARKRLKRLISIGTKAFGQRSACADRKSTLRIGEGRRPARKRLKRLISIGTKAFGRRSACADRKSTLRVGEGQRPARKRLKRLISIGTKAFGRRSACADRKSTLRVGEGQRPARSALEGRFQSAQSLRPAACTPNEFGLQEPPADGRPAPTEERRLRRRRPTPGAQRLGRPISIGTEPSAGGLHAE
jgi:hypothetical protein